MSAHSDDSESLLGDSAYEVLTDSTILTDDEDDGGSSVASLDGHSEDSGSLAEMESISGANSDTHEDEDLQSGIPSFGGLDDVHHELDDSEITLREDGAGLAESNAFEEPENYSGEQLHVVRTVTTFSEAEATEIYRHLRVDEIQPTRLFATIRQTMTRQLLAMDEPFRLMYIGSTAAKDEITHKLAEALAVPVCQSLSSTGSWEGVNTSRYNIVPVTSFGTRSSSPEVELVESLGVEMLVDVCTAAKTTKREGRSDTLSLWLNGNQSASSFHGENGFQLESPGWKLPHLAVVYCSDDDNIQRRMTRSAARAFMLRHSVPTLVICQNPLYYKPQETYTLDTRSIHMCLESETSSTGDVIHKRMPIDLSNFLSLDVRQLNRNIACITGLVSGTGNEIAPAPVGRTRKSSNSLMRDIEKTPHHFGGDSLLWYKENKREDLWKVFLVGWLFVFGIVGATISIAYLKLSKAPEPPGIIEPVVQPVSAIMTVATAASSMSLPPSSLTKPPPSSQVAVTTSYASCATKPDLSNYLYDPTKIALNESDEFQIHVIGSSNIILRPPQKYLLLKKPPRLFIRVTRDEQMINADLSKLFDGIYTLTLNPDDAWGLVNVAITTKSKPIINETLEVDFGTPWLKVSGWKKVAAQKKTELQSVLGQATEEAKTIAGELSNTAGQLSHTAGHQAAEVMDVVVATTKEWKKSLMKAYADTKALSVKHWPAIPTEGKEYVRKAQSRAKSIWESRRKGLSARAGAEKKR